MTQRKGRVTIPTDLDVVPQTLEMLDKWGADAIRDCDGTEFPEKLKNTGAKIYATYYTTRKDNKWAKENPDEIQQMYIMTSFHTAVSDTLEIHLMDHLYPDMLAVNTRDDIQMNITETSAWLQQPQAGTKITANIPEPTDFISLMQT